MGVSVGNFFQEKDGNTFTSIRLKMWPEDTATFSKLFRENKNKSFKSREIAFASRLSYKKKVNFKEWVFPNQIKEDEDCDELDQSVENPKKRMKKSEDDDFILENFEDEQPKIEEEENIEEDIKKTEGGKYIDVCPFDTDFVENYPTEIIVDYLIFKLSPTVYEVSHKFNLGFDFGILKFRKPDYGSVCENYE
jgi:hypothetical protein